MEPTTPFKRRTVNETLPPPSPSPMDVEDYFDLAYEIDEFGVHIPEYLAAK